MKISRHLMRATIGAALLSLTATAHAALFGLTSYLQQSDSPFSALSFSNFYLQNFESFAHETPVGSINLNSGGTTVTVSGGSNIRAIAGSGATDSVDADDGAIDGTGGAGHSLFTGGGTTGITFTFGGILPTHAGVVWTDAGPGATFRFEAFDHLGVSLGILGPGTADGANTGATAEDRFGGYSNSLGISSLRVWTSAGGIELDHFQYGTIGSPNPKSTPDAGSTVALLALGLGALGFARRMLGGLAA